VIEEEWLMSAIDPWIKRIGYIVFHLHLFWTFLHFSRFCRFSENFRRSNASRLTRVFSASLKLLLGSQRAKGSPCVRTYGRVATCPGLASRRRVEVPQPETTVPPFQTRKLAARNLIAPDHAPKISTNVTTGGVLQICTQKLAKGTRPLINDRSPHQKDPEYPLLHHGIIAGVSRRTTLALFERFKYVTNYTITVLLFRINFLLLPKTKTFCTFPKVWGPNRSPPLTYSLFFKSSLRASSVHPNHWFLHPSNIYADFYQLKSDQIKTIHHISPPLHIHINPMSFPHIATSPDQVPNQSKHFPTLQSSPSISGVPTIHQWAHPKPRKEYPRYPLFLACTSPNGHLPLVHQCSCHLGYVLGFNRLHFSATLC
jgi:hypothetical protein